MANKTKLTVILSVLILIYLAFNLFYFRLSNSFKQETLQQPDNWQRIEEEFSRCNVESAGQAHNLTVGVTLKDGTNISAVEPKIDDIMKLVADSRTKCNETVQFITE